MAAPDSSRNSHARPEIMDLPAKRLHSYNGPAQDGNHRGADCRGDVWVYVLNPELCQNRCYCGEQGRKHGPAEPCHRRSLEIIASLSLPPLEPSLPDKPENWLKSRLGNFELGVYNFRCKNRPRRQREMRSIVVGDPV